MNKEEIHLLSVQLLFKYYKKDITDLHATHTEKIVLDNDVLKNLNERLYITTLDKHNDLQQRIDKAIEYIEYIGMDATFDKVLIEILGGKE